MASNNKNFKNIRYYLIAGTLALIAFATVFYVRWSRLYYEPAFAIDNENVLYLDDESSLQEVATKLDSSRWLRSSPKLLWAGDMLGWDKFDRGRYEIDPGMSYNDFLKKLGLGLQDPQKVTIPPGVNIETLKSRLSNQFAFDSIAIHRAFEDSVYLSKKKLSRQELFGRMFPNTYQFYWTTSPKTVLDKVLQTFDEQVVKAFSERFKEIRFNVNEIIILASIVEWEAHKEEEKSTISGLYWNRLDRGMRLQADPTVLYALGEKRRLYFKDYKIEHPYNTYIHDGLPPGPITNPGRGSIRAALYPEEHDYLYMVATPEGTHLFSETFAQHKQKSRNWRKWIREQYRLKREREQQKAPQSDP